MAWKLLFATVFLCGLSLALSDNSWFIDTDIVDSFKQGMKEMEEAAKRVSDLMGEETKDRSREDLEDDDDDKNPANPDDSSQEDVEVNKKPEKPEQDEDDDDEDDDEVPDISSVLHNFPNIFSILKTPAMRPWWEGPNVCVDRDVKESAKENETESGNNFFIFGTAQFSSCKHSPNKYTCTTITSENGKTKTSTVTYQCCHGYRRSRSKPGCEKVDTKSLVEMSEESGCNQFSSMLRSADLEELKNPNITLFAPTDDAIAQYQDAMKHENNIDTLGSLKGGIMTNEVLDETQNVGSSNNKLILNHIVDGLIVTDDFYNDKMLYSKNDNSSLRINVFPGRRTTTVTVNCARLNVSDKVSTEGVLHTVERVITPVTKSVLELLDQPKYSSFKSMLEESDLLSKLDGTGPFTILAITNEALDKSKISNMCLRRVLEHHILPHTVCSEAAAQGKISALDYVSDWLRLENDEEGNLLLDGTVKASRTDILATNGVLHEVTDFVIPQAAKSASELLKATNHTKFLALVERANLLETLDKSEDITVFVPSEKSLTANEDDMLDMTDSQLKEMLQFHIVPKRVPSNKLKNKDMLPTLVKDKSLPVSLVSNILAGLAGLGTRALVQCSPLTRIDGDVCNGVVHEISTPVFPPTKSLYETIASDKQLESFRQVLEGTKLEEELKSGSLKDVTVLAPTNEAFEKMGSGNMDIVLKDKDLADQILRNHVLKGMVCCSGVGASSWPFLSSEFTITGSTIETNRSFRSNTVTFAGVPTNKCDIATNEGLIHLLNGVILPIGHRRNTDIIFRRPNKEIILTGF